MNEEFQRVIYKKRYLLTLSICILIGITLFFLIMNVKTPMMGEDFALISFYPSYTPNSTMEHISLIIKRIIYQASNWNIRVGEQISIIFGSIDKIYYYIGNTIMSVLYVLLIPIYTFGRKLRLNEKDDVISIVISFCLIILFQPALGEIFFWRTGSSNYLWAVFILLIFTIPLRMILVNRNILGDNKVFILLHTLLGLFAGLTNENTVITFILLYIFTIIYRIKKNREVYSWMWSSFISLGTGFLIMIFAPSTKIRIQTYKKMFGIKDVSIQDYIYRAVNIIHIFFTQNACLVILLLSILIIYIALNYKKIKDGKRKKELYIYKTAFINLVLLLASSLSAGALIAAPYVETRSFLLMDFFMMGCIIYFIIQLINSANKFMRSIMYILLGILLIFTIKEDIKIFTTYNDYNNFITNNYKIIEEAKSNNRSSVKILPYKYANNRILNTREEYLQSNLDYLKGYFGIEVLYSMGNYYLINEKQLAAKYIEIMNNIDYIEYKQDENQMRIIGWAAIRNQNSKHNDISILLKSNSKTYQFTTDKNKRKDVSKYFNSNYYDDTGFSLYISNLDKILEKDKYTIGLCIKNNTNNTNYIMYTEKVIDIK